MMLCMNKLVRLHSSPIPFSELGSWFLCVDQSASLATFSGGKCGALAAAVQITLFALSERAFSVNTREGDVVLIDCVGAYGRCMASTYNLRDPGHELVLGLGE